MFTGKNIKKCINSGSSSVIFGMLTKRVFSGRGFPRLAQMKQLIL